MPAVLTNYCMSQNMTNVHFLNSSHISLLLANSRRIKTPGKHGTLNATELAPQQTYKL